MQAASKSFAKLLGLANEQNRFLTKFVSLQQAKQAQNSDAERRYYDTAEVAVSLNTTTKEYQVRCP